MVDEWLQNLMGSMMDALSASPSSAPKSSFKPRRPWLALLLSLSGGPLGQIYVGRLRRSLFLWFLSMCVLAVLIFCIISLPIGRIGLYLLCLFALAIPVFFAIDAFSLAKRNPNGPLKRYQRWYFYILFYVVLYFGNIAAALLVRSYIAEAFVVPTRGMSPTIQPGDRLLVDIWNRHTPIRRDDIVVFRSKGPGSPLFVQRVIGLPGDEIEVRNERVLINGVEWEDRHAVFDAPLPDCKEIVNYGPVKVPSDSCFLLGDNRRRSMDGRLRGPVPLSDIYGLARWIYWSRERKFPNPNDTSHYVLGPIYWNRLGLRLDDPDLVIR
jgi:signal peptidase I